MEKRHYYRVRWTTRTMVPSSSGRYPSDRSFSHEYDTEAEAVKKARKVSKRTSSSWIRVYEMESWDTPDPAPNGTHHCSFLGFIAWWEN